MHYFSTLFDKVLYMFRTGPLSIIWSISTLYTQQQVFVIPVLLASASRCQQNQHDISKRQKNQHDKYLLRAYSVEILLMMDSGPVRNTKSTLSNKFEKQCILLAFIIRVWYNLLTCTKYRKKLKYQFDKRCISLVYIILSHYSARYRKKHKNAVVFLAVFSFLCINIGVGAFFLFYFFFPTPRIPCGLARRPVRVLEQF